MHNGYSCRSSKAASWSQVGATAERRRRALMAYTILLTGKETAGRDCLIDMYVPPGGGPPPHRHDFEESSTVLAGEIEATFRGKTSTVPAGETISIPANAPHLFRNKSKEAARLLCLCSPAGQEEFFLEVGIPVPTRTTPRRPRAARQEAQRCSYPPSGTKLASAQACPLTSAPAGGQHETSQVRRTP